MADGNSESPRLREAFRALRYYNFRLFFAGQLISLVGTWMQMVAQSWLVYRLTGSSALLGLIGFSSQIPVFLFSPFGGVAADRHNRHRMIVVTQSLSMVLALTLAALTLSGHIQIWHLFVLSALLGVVNAFDIPARQAFFQEMVGRADLINAIALNSSMFNSARIVGPAIAGLLVAWIGEGWCFFANGVSYIAVIAGLLLMHVTPRVIHNSDDSAWQHVLEGARFVASARPIRALLLLVALVSFSGLQYSVLMPIFADRIFHSGAHGLGVLLGINGAGALCGALVMAAKRGLQGLSRWIAIAAITFSVAIIAFGYAPNFWMAAGLSVRSRIFDHDPVRLHQHADPDDDAGPAPGPCHLGVFHDVHGDDPYRFAGRRYHRRTHRRSHHNCRGWCNLPGWSDLLCDPARGNPLGSAQNGAERVRGHA